MTARPMLDDYFMGIAHATRERSTCPRAMVGAVLVNDNLIVGTGYNGAPKGMPHCDQVGCMTGDDGHCRLAVHAELNALLNATGSGDTLYATHMPCFNCLKAAINAGVRRIVYDLEYVDRDRDLFLELTREVRTFVGPEIEQIRRAR